MVPAKVIEVDGFQWMLGGTETDDHLGPAPHEGNLEPVVRGLLGQDKVFLDVGAHVGHYTIRLARQASHVIAVEASPETAAVLRENIALNSLGARVTVLEVAAWDSHTSLRLEDPNGKAHGGSTRVLSVAETVYGPIVPAAPLDDMLDNSQEVGLVKLDVEGADLHALRGMEKMLRREQPIMFIERHDQYGYYSIKEMYSLLDSLGYQWCDGPEYMGAKYLICHPREMESA